MYLNRFRIQRLYFLVDATGRNSNRNNVVIPRSWKSQQSLQIMILMLNKLNYHCFVTIKKPIPIRVNYRYQSLHMLFCLQSQTYDERANDYLHPRANRNFTMYQYYIPNFSASKLKSSVPLSVLYLIGNDSHALAYWCHTHLTTTCIYK